MGPGLFKLLKTVEIIPVIFTMLVQGLLGPLRKTGKFIIIRIIITEIIRQLPPDDKLLQKGLFGLPWGIGLLYFPGHPLRGNLAKME